MWQKHVNKNHCSHEKPPQIAGVASRLAFKSYMNKKNAFTKENDYSTLEGCLGGRLSTLVGVDGCLGDLPVLGGPLTWNFSSLPMDEGKDGVLRSLLFLLLQSLL